MRILHLLDYGYTIGGAEICVMTMNEALNRRGHSSRIFASNAGRLENPEKEILADYWCYGTIGRTRVINQFFNFRALKRLKQVLVEFDPEIVHLHMFLTQLSPMVLREIGHLPVIHTAHWFRDVCLTGFKTLPGGKSCLHPVGPACLSEGCVPFRDWVPQIGQMKLFNQYKHFINRNIAISETVKSRLESGGIHVDDVITSCTTNQNTRSHLVDPPRIGFAARMAREKGGFVLLDAVKLILDQLPETQLDVFGDGPCLQELISHAEKKGLSDHVHFHGYMDQDQLQNELANSWIQVAPTLVEEPLGMVAIEAAKRGSAMVASNLGGFKELITQGETGYLTPVGDSSSLADAMLKLLSNKSRAEQFGRANRSRAEHLWATDTLMNRYIEHYEELVSHDVV